MTDESDKGVWIAAIERALKVAKGNGAKTHPRVAAIGGRIVLSDDIVKRLRDEIDIDANEPIDPLLLEEAADEIERLRDIVEKVAMGSFLNETMFDAIRDALKYISAMPAKG